MWLVTGANGQLGCELRRLIPNAVFADSKMLDITGTTDVMNFVCEKNIDLIINCAAYTAVDKAESEPDIARRVNVDGVRNLALTGVPLIHISTDYVFDGKGHRPYSPSDKTNPVSVYGQTKLQGENVIMGITKTAVIIRTAWLYSAYGNNFVKTMLRLGAERDELNVVTDQIGTPTWAADLAAAIVKVAGALKPGTRAIYHYSNAGACSWYDFAHSIMELSGLKCKVNPINTAQYPTPAKRPHYSVLDKGDIVRDFGVSVPHWRDSLKKALDEFAINSH